MSTVANVISNLHASLSALQELQKTNPDRTKAIAITDLEKVIVWLEHFNKG